MLGEYKINRCTRQCFALERPLKDGEWYYSVIIENGDGYERRDYSAEAWTQPPPGTIGWWKKQRPQTDEKKLVLAPPEVLVDLLRQMERFPNKIKSRYLLALMLMRKRVVRPAASPIRDEGKNQKPQPELAGSMENIVVEVVADGSQIEVPIATIGKSESETLREELSDLLYCEADEESSLVGDKEDLDAEA